MKEVVIIDYEGSNLFSVKRAFEHLGISVKISSDPGALATATAAVLPGVGAFGAAMDRLRALGFVEALSAYVRSQRPLLGVCLGMQLLFTNSEEFGLQQGLNIVPGSVKRFPTDGPGERARVPQIGWNTIHPPLHGQRWQDSPLTEVPEGAFMYFVHSFYCIPDERAVIMSLTRYAGLEYCSSLRAGNIFATQFHPEKSAQLGLSIYRNWARLADLLD